VTLEAMLATDTSMILLRIVHIATGVIWVYRHDWHVYPSFGDWIGSSFGTWLTAGALLAVAGLVVAGSLTRPTIARLIVLGKQVAASGAAAPSPETAARIAALQHRLILAERLSFSLVLLAVVAMSSARYL
jgi:hypothetical protein